VKIDQEFEELCPPLASDELAGLEASLKADGCLSPLIAWSVPAIKCLSCGAPKSALKWEVHSILAGGEQVKHWRCDDCDEWDLDDELILVDGHNRYDICEDNNIPYKVVQKSFASRDDVKEFIIRLQFNRRNLQPFQRAELALKLKTLIAAKATTNQVVNGHNRQSVQTFAHSEPPQELPIVPIKTRQEMASLAGVSHETLRKAEVIQAKAPEAVKEQLRRGEQTINSVYRAVEPKPAPTADDFLDKANRAIDRLIHECPWKCRGDFARMLRTSAQYVEKQA
jgi:hypothetical protein